ncbi:MAG: hypothetical protein II697_07410, partial [Clostridia bacterium]|nr:hypothetical protein [Clostridia bacterium]
MGWFDEQIEYRKQHEKELLDGTFENIARSVTGRRVSTLGQSHADVSDAVSALMKYLGVKEKEVPAGIENLEDRLDFLLSSTGILYREIELKRGWRKDAMGAMISSLRDSGQVIALLPSDMGAYEYIDPQSGARRHVGAREEKLISTEALVFYRPLPMRELKIKDLTRYMASCLTVRDVVGFGLAALSITLVGMLMPKLNQILMGTVVGYKSTTLLIAVMSFMLFATIGSLLFGIIRALLLNRIRIKMDLSVGAATMMRILSLPASFFKSYSAGELNQYISYMNQLCETIVDSLFSTAITGVFSLVYLGQIFAFAPSLVWPSLIVTLLTLGISMVSGLVMTRLNREKMTYIAKERGLVYSLITGIQKIRLSGAENRAFIKWSQQFTKSATLTYAPPAIVRLSGVLTGFISLCGTAIMYFVAVKSRVTVADYYAFNAAYAYISQAFGALAQVALTAASIKPVIALIAPLLEAKPETGDQRQTVTKLSGSIELSHVTFGYDP